MNYSPFLRAWHHPILPPEGNVKIRMLRIAALGCNFLNGQIGLGQQLLTLLKAQIPQVIIKGYAIQVLKTILQGPDIRPAFRASWVIEWCSRRFAIIISSAVTAQSRAPCVINALPKVSPRLKTKNIPDWIEEVIPQMRRAIDEPKPI